LRLTAGGAAESRQVFILVNGGSASTDSDFVCDLAKNERRSGWPPFG
jgi:D-sedoheptulose 7-phosphate isomerase